MKIDTLSLRPYSNIVAKNRVTGNDLWETCVLDFENNQLYFRSPNTFGKIALNVELEDGEEPENFAVDSEKFFYLVNWYDDLILKDKVFYSPEGEEIKLKNLPDDYHKPSFDEDWEEVELDLTEELFSHIQKSISYHDVDENSAYNGVFITKNKLVATDAGKFYEVAIDQEVPDMNLPIDFVRNLLRAFTVGDTLTIGKLEKGDAHIFKFVKDTLSFRMSSVLNLNLSIDVEDENFISAYDHENYIKFNRHELNDVLSFLQPFTRDIVANRIKLSVEEDDGQSELVVEVMDANYVKKKIVLEDISDIDYFLESDNNIWISASVLKMAINHLDSADSIIMQIDNELPAMNLYCEGNKDDHVICTRLTE
jgi:hypothetical protein